jgi:hypothetical protein
MTRTHRHLLAAATLAACPLVSSASVLAITSNGSLSTEGLGAFTGTLDYNFIGGNTGTLQVSLANTTPGTIGGYITAFMFRTPTDLGSFSSSLTASDYPMMTNIPAGTSGAPWNGTGSWMGGAGINGSWLAGGSPEGGVAVGSTGHWTFTITGANASMLDSDSFVSGDDVSDPYAFIVRFRGMALPDGSDGSDKVPANQLPAPGAVALVGLAGLITRRRSA